MLHSIFRIARKEIASFFASPIAFIFLAAFLLITLFIFFWVETFFARNISDVRPLFEWMPVLLIFLVSALTMKMWSEENRMGTQEFLMTQPVSSLQLVLGKFFACMTLVAIALLLTLPLPITVSMLGELDWGPVLGAYLATLFLAAAYTAIGLTISARTDSQIISLIVTIIICAIFYLLGSDTLVSLVGNQAGELLKSLGSGSRFTSITRGIIDLRDLYYYLSIVGIFLSLNVYFLESSRWKNSASTLSHSGWRWITVLLIGNFMIANLWLKPIGWARADVTEGKIYSISEATKNYLNQLQEPLLIRGYFSAKTHPLLAPLVPQLRDLIEEFRIASDGKVRVEFIDPLENPELEEEAGQKYGIRPVPFQITDKYQASLVNSYFDVLIQYGDQHEVLGFQKLIEIKSQSEADLQVELRNPEYEITRTIKKVLYEYQSAGDLFANMAQPLSFTGYISAEQKLPEVLAKFKPEMQNVLDQLKTDAKGKFTYTLLEPEANNNQIANEIADKYGLQAMRAGMFDTNAFYYYMILKAEGQTQVIQIPLSEDLSKDAFKRGIDAALKRFSTGFVKTVGLYTPPPEQANPMMRQFRMPSGKQFNALQDKLRENHNVSPLELDNGIVPDVTDLLLVAAPSKLNDKQVFAIDQFLMKGGTVILSTAPFSATSGQGSLSVAKHESGLKGWLKHHGINQTESLVLDPQNAMLPIPIKRNLGGYEVQEIRMVEYPYFIDLRRDGMLNETITAGLDQLTFNWASPFITDEAKNQGRTITPLLNSSANAWLSDSTEVIPDFQTHGALGFQVNSQRAAYPLAVVVEGTFESFFKGKASPLLKKDTEPKPEAGKTDSTTEEKDKTPVIASVIEKSPQSARIILLGSNEFLSDQTLQLAASSGGTLYLNSLQLVENAVDWSLEDRGLLSIRSRSHFSRTLNPLNSGDQIFWEYLNYALALLGLLLVYLGYRLLRHRKYHHYLDILQEQEV